VVESWRVLDKEEDETYLPNLCGSDLSSVERGSKLVPRCLGTIFGFPLSDALALRNYDGRSETLGEQYLTWTQGCDDYSRGQRSIPIDSDKCR
jgi:hypothetical protein